MDSPKSITAALEAATLDDTDRPEVTTHNPQTGSALVTLPPEVRNHIYELAFTTNSGTAPFSLAEATAPSKALLSTCRKLRHEAQGFWEAARMNFWANTHFYHDRDSNGHCMKALEATTETQIALMAKLEINDESSYWGTWTFDNGIWFRSFESDWYGGLMHSLCAFYPSDAMHLLMDAFDGANCQLHYDELVIAQPCKGLCYFRISTVLGEGMSTEAQQEKLRALKSLTGYERLSRLEVSVVLRNDGEFPGPPIDIT